MASGGSATQDKLWFELKSVLGERDGASQDFHFAEVVRHFPGMVPALWAIYEDHEIGWYDRVGRCCLTEQDDAETRLYAGACSVTWEGHMEDSPLVEPVASLGDAQERLRIAAANVRAVEEWLSRLDLMDRASERTRLTLERIALELDVLVHVVQFDGENG